MKKLINPCRLDTGNKFKSPVYVAINFNEEGGNLPITGVVGPLASGNCTGSCGQIVDELLDESRTMSLGWTPEMVDDLVTVWKEWHLNDMTPGSPRQMEFLRGKHLSYEAVDVHVNGKRVFHRECGGLWQYVEGTSSGS